MSHKKDSVEHCVIFCVAHFHEVWIIVCESQRFVLIQSADLPHLFVSVNAKSKMSMLSSMRSSCEDFGMTTMVVH